MTNISHNLAGRIDDKTVAILSEIDQLAGNLKLPFFIVGAMARDIILQHAHNIYTTRATLDIDIGVFVTDWDQFEKLKNSLVHTRKFQSTKQTQRLMYDDEYAVDIVPFGEIAEKDGSISWPPEHEIEMSIMGFQESYEHAVSVLVRANPDLVVKVVSLAGLAVLKLIAWKDGIERRGKDAADLYTIITNYIEAGNVDRFFEEEGDILKEENSDYDRASAHLLGREMAKIAASKTKATLINLLEREAGASQGHKIAMDILRQDMFNKLTYEGTVSYFHALLRGLTD